MNQKTIMKIIHFDFNFGHEPNGWEYWHSDSHSNSFRFLFWSWTKHTPSLKRLKLKLDMNISSWKFPCSLSKPQYTENLLSNTKIYLPFSWKQIIFWLTKDFLKSIVFYRNMLHHLVIPDETFTWVWCINLLLHHYKVWAGIL